MPRRNGKERTRLSSTLLNSDKHAQHIWKKAHDSAVKTYGEGERRRRKSSVRAKSGASRKRA